MNTPTLPVLTGTAVTLRPITDADTDLIVKWRNTPSVVQNFIFRQTFTPEMHRSWLATKVATGQVVQYIILDNADGKPVGSVYYRDIDNHNRSAEYGIFIASLKIRRSTRRLRWGQSLTWATVIRSRPTAASRPPPLRSWTPTAAGWPRRMRGSPTISVPSGTRWPCNLQITAESPLQPAHTLAIME